MALKPKMANVPMLDGNGYVINGKLDSIEEIENDHGQEQYTFKFSCDGSKRRMEFTVWTGIKFNLEMSDMTSQMDKKGKKVLSKFRDEKLAKNAYNALTQLSLNLGLITKDELKTLTDDNMPDLESLIGKEVKFKLNKQGQFHNLNIDTLSLA